MTLVTIVVAADERGGIGHAGQLPWHLPADLRRFKSLTMGKPMIMGRRTWDSIGRPLPGRHSIVVTRDRTLAIEGATVVHSFDEALRAAGGVAEISVIGGAAIFELFEPIADKIELTEVIAEIAGDVSMPDLRSSERWREVASEDHMPTAETPAWRTVTLVRA